VKDLKGVQEVALASVDVAHANIVLQFLGGCKFGGGNI
jgi:hypothetical protein